MFRYSFAVVTGRLLRWNMFHEPVAAAILDRAANLGPGVKAEFSPYLLGAHSALRLLFHPVEGAFPRAAPGSVAHYRMMYGIFIGAYTHSLNWFETADIRGARVIDLGVDGLSHGIDQFWEIVPPAPVEGDAALHEYVKRIEDAAFTLALPWIERVSSLSEFRLGFGAAFRVGASEVAHHRQQFTARAA